MKLERPFDVEKWLDPNKVLYYVVSKRNPGVRSSPAC
jgi:hypothetical protein